jgi:hypothetical protein
VINEALIDRLAEAVHENYLREQLADGVSMGSTASLRPWAELDEDLRESNRAQARDIAHKVAAVGASIVAADDADPAFAFSDAEIEALAREEHSRWSAQRGAAGWVPGRTRDDARKVHPFLTSWETLPEAERDKDRDAVRNIPCVLAHVGLAVTRTVQEP